MIEDVRLLTAGHCVHPEAMTRRGGRWAPTRYAAGFALIHHARQGAILFDTGYSDHFFTETRKWPGSLYARITPVHFDQAQAACRQAAADGVAPRDVRHVIISHFHADHVSGLRDFPAARFWCTRAAWESVRRASGLRAVTRGILPGLMPPDLEQRLSFVDDRPAAITPPFLIPFGGARDLFGDGAMLTVDLPGHGVGQIGLFLSAAPREPLFLVADAAWSRQAIASTTPPPLVSTAFLGHTRAYRATLGRLHRLHQTMPSLMIVPSHDTPGDEAASSP